MRSGMAAGLAAGMLWALGAVGCVGDAGERASAPVGCDEACQEDGKNAIFYVPRYYTKKWSKDFPWARDNANAAADLLRADGWNVVVQIVASLDEAVADMKERAARGEKYDFLATVGHSDPRGPFFGNRGGGGTREDLQAGWDWYGPGIIAPASLGKGDARIDGLRELTDPMAALLEPTGFITLIGCRTAQNRAEVKNHTQFLKPSSVRYETYAHAVAELTGHCVLGNQSRRSLGYTAELVDTVFHGGVDGQGAVPFEYREICPAGAPLPSAAAAADELLAVNESDWLEAGTTCADETCGVPEDEAASIDDETEAGEDGLGEDMLAYEEEEPSEG